ncbi:MAG: zinc-ribbon domain containing protein [Planctomycetota bacterium]
MDAPKNYDDYVDHPRFGRAPRRTSLRVPVDAHPHEIYLHWINGPFYGEGGPEHVPEWSDDTWTVPGTAVVADPDVQREPTVAVTHYFDLDKRCVDCRRRFLFFAVEQKHWYEELGLPLEANAIRCVPCRKALRDGKAKQQRYMELLALDQRTPEESLEAAVAFLDLVDVGFFGAGRFDRVRALLNAAREDLGEQARWRDALARVVELEERPRQA